jgi:DNA-binding CsgD family transcriptional regulator
MPNILSTQLPLSTICFTKREKQVLKYIVLGCTAKKMGQLLGISSRTVEVYINQLKIKLNCFSKNEITMKIIQNSLMNKIEHVE